MRDIQRIALQPCFLVTVSAIINAAERDPLAAVFQMTGHAELGMQRIAGFLETGLEEAEHGMTFLREIMTTETLAIPGLLQPEIGSRCPPPKQMTDIGLQLLSQAAWRRSMAVLTGDILVAAGHRPAGMPSLLVRQQQYDEQQHADCETKDQAEILAKTSCHLWRCITGGSFQQ